MHFSNDETASPEGELHTFEVGQKLIWLDRFMLLPACGEVVGVDPNGLISQVKLKASDGRSLYAELDAKVLTHLHPSTDMAWAESILAKIIAQYEEREAEARARFYLDIRSLFPIASKVNAG